MDVEQPQPWLGSLSHTSGWECGIATDVIYLPSPSSISHADDSLCLRVSSRYSRHTITSVRIATLALAS